MQKNRIPAIYVFVTLNVAEIPVSFDSGNLLMLPRDIFLRYVSQIRANKIKTAS